MVAPDGTAALLDFAPATVPGAPEFTIRHSLAGEPLLSIAALARLAGTLPPGWLRSYPARDVAGAAPAAVADPPTPTSVSEQIADLATSGRSIRLLHLELAPGYRSLVTRVLGELEAGMGLAAGIRRDGSSTAFLASPGAHTPLHCDHHHNLLMQICGSKELVLGFVDDPAKVQCHIEMSLTGAAEVRPDRTRRLTLEPGDAVYIPPFAFHGVSVGSQPSVALSCAFSTAETEWAVLVHRTNSRLRRLGLSPQPPRRGRAADDAKALLGDVLSRLWRRSRAGGRLR